MIIYCEWDKMLIVLYLYVFYFILFCSSVGSLFKETFNSSGSIASNEYRIANELALIFRKWSEEV